MSDIAFGFQAAPASDVHKSDQALYREVMEDCALGRKLGYDAAWLLEHHFSDYYPTPSPLLFMAHIAAAFPDLSLGTSVLVLPWYHPLRLAEEIAMLNGMTTGTLHLGIGRGTAKMEYDAYNVDMNEARARFAECYRIVEKGLAGEPFTHDGRFWKIDKPIRLRPEPGDKKVRFYGAIGSPASAEVMGDPGVAPICLSTFPDKLLAKILERWSTRAGATARDAILPISVKMFIADTDEEAQALATTRPTSTCNAPTTSPTPTRGPTSPSTRTSAACSPTCASSPTRPSWGRSWTRTWWAVRRRSAGASTSSPPSASTTSWCPAPRPTRRSDCASA
jgi:alkanesulfonate monooxygenase SsuD/methylene tetrahydromethanopterin reductase-like flavin-dependent oxidoreductase (luciferase family)